MTDTMENAAGTTAMESVHFLFGKGAVLEGHARVRLRGGVMAPRIGSEPGAPQPEKQTLISPFFHGRLPHTIPFAFMSGLPFALRPLVQALAACMPLPHSDSINASAFQAPSTAVSSTTRPAAFKSASAARARRATP